MNQHSKNTTDTPSFIVSIVLFFLIIFISLIPVVVQGMDRPEKLLPQSSRWEVIAYSTDKSVWDASDGFSADHVETEPTQSGFRVILRPTESSTREAFYNECLITKNTFRLSAEVNTPTPCHNGLIFRRNAQGEYYLFLVSSTSTYTVEILRRVAGHDLPREAIILNTQIPDSIGQSQYLTVIGRGEVFYFYINGVYMNQMIDSRLNGNRVGVEVFT